MKKKTWVLPLILVVLAAIAAVGVKTFLAPCIHDDGTFGACHWAGQALFGTALLVGAEGLAAICLKKSDVQRGLFISMAATSVLGICIPGGLISLCGMTTMRCRALMRPAMTILFVVMAIISVIGCLTSRDRQI